MSDRNSPLRGYPMLPPPQRLRTLDPRTGVPLPTQDVAAALAASPRPLPSADPLSIRLAMSPPPDAATAQRAAPLSASALAALSGPRVDSGLSPRRYQQAAPPAPTPEYLTVRAAKERVDRLQSEIAAFEDRLRDRSATLYEHIARAGGVSPGAPAASPTSVREPARSRLPQGGPALSGVMSPPSRVPISRAAASPLSPPTIDTMARVQAREEEVRRLLDAKASDAAAAAAQSRRLQEATASLAAARAAPSPAARRSPPQVRVSSPVRSPPQQYGQSRMEADVARITAVESRTRCLEEQMAQERKQADETISRLLSAVRDLRSSNAKSAPPPPQPGPPEVPPDQAAVPAPAPPAAQESALRRVQELASECQVLREKVAKLEGQLSERDKRIAELEKQPAPAALAPGASQREIVTPRGRKQLGHPRVSVELVGTPLDADLGDTVRSSPARRASLSRSPRGARRVASVTFEEGQLRQDSHGYREKASRHPSSLPSPANSDLSARRVAFIGDVSLGDSPHSCEKTKRIKELEAELGRLRARGEQENAPPAALSEQVQQRVKETFGQIDAQCNEDGSISKPELLRVLREERLGAKVLFRELDTNENGDVTLEEWFAWFQRIEGAGRSAENMLDWIEERLKEVKEHRHVGFTEDPPTRPKSPAPRHMTESLSARAESTFVAVDAMCNKDGTVSKEELLRVLREEKLGAKILFRELDANADGDITVDEWMTWLNRLETHGRSAENMIEWIEDRLEQVQGEGRAKHSVTVIAPRVELSDDLVRRAEACFANVDAQCSKDGSVSMEELISVLREERLGAKVLFHELDMNEDGDVSLNQWMMWFKKIEEQGRSAENMVEWIEDRLADVLRGTDTKDELELLREQNTRLKEELQVAEQAFNSGSPLMTEYRGPLTDEHKRRAESVFKVVEGLCKRSGSVSKIELEQLMKEDHLAAKILFRELDADSDGTLTLTEWLTWFDKLERANRSAENMIEWLEEKMRSIQSAAQPEELLSRTNTEPVYKDSPNESLPYLARVAELAGGPSAAPALAAAVCAESTGSGPAWTPGLSSLQPAGVRLPPADLGSEQISAAPCIPTPGLGALYRQSSSGAQPLHLGDPPAGNGIATPQSACLGHTSTSQGVQGLDLLRKASGQVRKAPAECNREMELLEAQESDAGQGVALLRESSANMSGDVERGLKLLEAAMPPQ